MSDLRIMDHPILLQLLKVIAVGVDVVQGSTLIVVSPAVAVCESVSYFGYPICTANLSLPAQDFLCIFSK